MENQLLYRIILSTDKKERKDFSKSMFWSGFSYRTSQQKDKLRRSMKYFSVFNPICCILFIMIVILGSFQWWMIIGLIIMLYGLLLTLVIPCGDYYINEYKSKFLRKKGILRESFDSISFYEDHMSYNGLKYSRLNKEKVGFKGFKFKETNNSFYLVFILNENRKAKLEGFFLLKYQDIEKSGVDIGTFREFLYKKANATNE